MQLNQSIKCAAFLDVIKCQDSKMQSYVYGSKFKPKCLKSKLSKIQSYVYGLNSKP